MRSPQTGTRERCVLAAPRARARAIATRDARALADRCVYTRVTRAAFALATTRLRLERIHSEIAST